MKASAFDTTSKDAFVQLQNAIVDPRYAQKRLANSSELRIADSSGLQRGCAIRLPKPGDVPDLMKRMDGDGSPSRTQGRIDPVVAAAVTASICLYPSFR